MNNTPRDNHHLYTTLQEHFSLTPPALQRFEQYATLLMHSTSNVTALHSLADIIAYHFADSLELGNAIPLSQQTIIDVGSGGGFPGIPLKIVHPECTVVLIEVVAKKRAFLQHVIQELGLQNITVEEKDWRTFLRTSPLHADIVCARASLQPSELLRMFQPQYHYQKSSLVYWASTSWEPTPREQTFIRALHPYHVGEKDRKLIIFQSS